MAENELVPSTTTDVRMKYVEDWVTAEERRQMCRVCPLTVAFDRMWEDICALPERKHWWQRVRRS